MEDNKLNNFLIKLWTILEDESISNTICWDRTGDSFHVYDVYRAWPHLSDSLICMALRKLPQLIDLCFTMTIIPSLCNLLTHFFVMDIRICSKKKRNQVAIKRRASRQDVQLLDAEQSQNTTLTNRQEQQNMVTLPEYDLNYLLEELQQFRIRTADMQNTIVDLTNDNELLWNEVSLLRDFHLKQQQNVSNLVEFLMSILHDNVNVRSQKQGKINCSRQIVPLQGPKIHWQ
uniref:HSF-type DNA-binding domain-containing protein n=1 Tax=Ditylenchus dipsaci TaxID=166011 RepID=A0A915ES40_9BILA